MRKKIVVIESRVEDWDFIALSENEYKIIGENVSFKEVAKDLECSPKLLKTIKVSLDYLRECVLDDLANLYKKMEE